MSGFALQLRASWGDLQGAPVVVDVLDARLRPVRQAIVPVGPPYSFEVPPGRYGVRVVLPSGQALTASVAAEDDPGDAQVVNLDEVSPYEWLERTVVLKSNPARPASNLRQSVYRSVWLRLWGRRQGVWRVINWSQHQAQQSAIRAPDAVRYWLQTERGRYMLQIGGPHIAWRMVSLPPGQRVEVTVRPTGRPDAATLAVTVASDNNVAEVLLGYLSTGAVDQATLVNRQAEDLLYGKRQDPAAAAVSGYFLLSVNDLERLHDWPRNLDRWMTWMPDGALIHAWQLIRQQQEVFRQLRKHETVRRSISPALLTARERLLEAVQRGLPVYTQGLRLLTAGLRLLDAESGGVDHEVRDAINRLRPFAAAADLTQPTTTFIGSSPTSTSAAPVYGIPASRRGLVYLYEVTLQDLIDLGLLHSETSLVWQSPSPLPTVTAAITAHGTMRLADGQEHTDPFLAAEAAGGIDPWRSWVVPGQGSLADLRERARSGLTGRASA